MKKRLTFWPTVIILVLSLGLIVAFMTWIWTALDLPDSLIPIWVTLISFVVFEIPARLGPKPFETILSSILKLSIKDKTIFLSSLVLGVVIVNYLGIQLKIPDSFSSLILMALFLVLIIAPIGIFGSPKAKKLMFKGKDKNVEPHH